MQIHQLDTVNLQPFQAGIHLINQSTNIRSMQIHQLDTVNLKPFQAGIHLINQSINQSQSINKSTNQPENQLIQPTTQSNN